MEQVGSVDIGSVGAVIGGRLTQIGGQQIPGLLGEKFEKVVSGLLGQKQPFQWRGFALPCAAGSPGLETGSCADISRAVGFLDPAMLTAGHVISSDRHGRVSNPPLRLRKNATVGRYAGDTFCRNAGSCTV